MSPKVPTALRIDSGIMEAMRELKERKGIPITAQLEMAVRDWLRNEHGVGVEKAERKRPASRKSS